MGKVCNKCNLLKDSCEYSIDRKLKDGLCRTCKSCRKIKNRKIYLLNAEHLKEKSRIWRNLNPERASTMKKEWYLRNAEFAKSRSASHYERNKEKRKAQMRQWYANNREHKNNKSLVWARENPEKVAAGVKKWTALNSERLREIYKTWYANNPHIRAASSAKRRSAKLKRTPKWLTDKEIFAIGKLYEKASLLQEETGIRHSVDHIYPLQGKYVSGLHVLANLQILTAEENSLKHNIWVP